MEPRRQYFHKMPLIQPTKIFNELDVKSQSLVVFSPYDWKLVCSMASIVPGSLQNLHFSSLQTVHINDAYITLAGPAIGAPLASMVLEVLIAFGSYKIMALGSCGSLTEKLRIGNFVIPEKAFPDEGTSSHYPLKGKKVSPSPQMLHRLKLLCGSQNQKWISGKVWTTDAPFRETPQKIKKFQQKEAIAVEMELSALFKVGNFYGVEVGALLVVSDELSSLHWKTGYKTPLYRSAFLKAANIAFDVLTQLE